MLGLDIVLTYIEILKNNHCDSVILKLIINTLKVNTELQKSPHKSYKKVVVVQCYKVNR